MQQYRRKQRSGVELLKGTSPGEKEEHPDRPKEGNCGQTLTRQEYTVSQE